MSVERNPRGQRSNPPFGNYLGYVKALSTQSPQYRELASGLEQTKASQLGRVHIQDIGSDGSHLEKLTFTHHEPDAAERLKHALSKYPAGIRTRLVLIEFRSSKRFDPSYGREEEVPLNDGLWSTVGLSLGIEPLFFEASWNKGLILRAREYPQRPEFLRLIYTTLKIMRDPRGAKDNIPTAVVAFNSSRKIEGEQIMYMMEKAPCLEDFQRSYKASEESKQESHFIRTLECDEQGRPSNAAAVGADASGVFLDILRAEKAFSSEDDLFWCLTVLTRIENMFFRASMTKFFTFWAEITGEPSEQMALRFRAVWRPCRRRLDNFKDASRAFKRYANRNFDQSDYRQRIDELQDDQAEALQEGQAIEAMLKDDMQCNVGNLQVEVAKSVLEESRRSIEEGKRLQLLTILAFVFIPLSLASSIFGMNVQEINNTGKSIWEFVLTAAILVLLALSGWFVMQWSELCKRAASKPS